MTDDPNGWPDPARPGVPLNPERDGWHWVVAADPGVSTESAPWWWCADKQHWLPPVAVSGTLPLSPSRVQWRYLGPCLTPAEVAAREADAALRVVREAMRKPSYKQVNGGGIAILETRLAQERRPIHSGAGDQAVACWRAMLAASPLREE